MHVLTKATFGTSPINRYRAARLIESADGVNFDFLNTVKYLLAHDYIRGTEGNQSWMFGSNDIVTREHAAVILMELQSHIKQLVGVPKLVTSEKKLPKRRFSEVHIKLALGSKILIAEFRADGTLLVEVQFWIRRKSIRLLRTLQPVEKVELDV